MECEWEWEWAWECSELFDEVEEERLCLWRGVCSCSSSFVDAAVRRPLVEERLAMEFSNVVGPERVGTSGVVSFTSSRTARRSCGSCVVCVLPKPAGLKLLFDFAEWSLGGRVCRAFLKHSVPQVSEYP